MRGFIQGFFYNNPDNYPPIINGARLLAKAGWHVELFCRDDGKRWDVSYPPEVQVQRIKAEGNSWQEYFAFVREAVRRGRHASVYLGHDMHGFVPARVLATRYHRPLVYQCHDFSQRTPGEALGGRIVRRFERRFARTASLVVVPDAERAKVITAELKLRTSPVVAANAPLSRSIARHNSLRTALASLDHNFDRIIFRQGRIGPGHAIEATVRSLPFWNSRRWAFVIMGLCDNDYVEHLASIARQLGVQGQFVILPPVGYDQVASFTADADVGHALYEPLHVNNVHITTASNKIMEYMSAGLPLLVSKQPALKNLVSEYGCGLAADENSPESIAASINTLLARDHVLGEMGAAGLQAFENVFCYERQFAPVIESISRLAHEESAAGRPGAMAVAAK